MHYYRAHYITNANFTHYSQGNPSNLPYICILRFHPKMAGICSLATFASGTSPLFLVLLPKSSAVKPIPLRKTTHHFLPMFSKPKKLWTKIQKQLADSKKMSNKNLQMCCSHQSFFVRHGQTKPKNRPSKKKTASIPQQSAMAKVLPPHTHILSPSNPPPPPNPSSSHMAVLK